ncbi:hypothetical protein EON80_14855 [bacterium]|nr:MAG: hypothetical protein EON80_14855 [bacterium]
MKTLLIAALAFAPLGAICAQPEPEVPKTSGFAPLDYFSAKCARCHGPNGSFYGAKFGKGLKDDAALKDAVKAMCDGPGGAPLEDPQLETLTDFHRALRDGKPYIVAVELKEGTLSGEASPDSKITLESGTKTLDVTTEGNTWSVKVEPDFVWKGAKLRAVKGEVETVIEL